MSFSLKSTHNSSKTQCKLRVQWEVTWPKESQWSINNNSNVLWSIRGFCLFFFCHNIRITIVIASRGNGNEWRSLGSLHLLQFGRSWRRKMYFNVVLTHYDAEAFALCPTVDDLDRLVNKVHRKSVDCLFLKWLECLCFSHRCLDRWDACQTLKWSFFFNSHF